LEGLPVTTQFLTAGLIIASLLCPIAVRAADADSDRSHPGAFVKDSVITTKVKAKLAAEKMRSLIHVGVDTDSNGMVVLSGNVRTQEVADKAVSIARDTEGVTSVQSHITIKQ
jgi:hyperosmotically inducible protein